MSPRFAAGSVVKRIAPRIRCAAAIATVVFPTPPLPPIRTTRRSARASNASFTVARVDPDAGLFVLVAAARLPGHLFLPRADVAKGLEDLRLFDAVLLLRNLAELQPHLLHDPLEAGHGRLEGKQQDVVEEEHGVSAVSSRLSALSSQGGAGLRAES